MNRVGTIISISNLMIKLSWFEKKFDSTFVCTCYIQIVDQNPHLSNKSIHINKKFHERPNLVLLEK